MNIQDIVNVSIGLSVTPASVASFNVPLLLVDHADIPIDRRYRIVTRSSYATDLTAATAQVNWCAALWGQNYNPAQAYIGRWVKTASTPYNVFPSATTTIATWTAVAAAGKFELDDGVNQEDISPDFTGDTSMADVCASINTALVASTNFSSYTCALDALNRVTITGTGTGSSALSFATGTPASGTDLSSSTYLGTEIAQAGLDAEAMGTAAAAIFALDNTPYIVCQSGGTISEVVAGSTSINALDKFFYLVIYDKDAKDSTSTTDAAYQIEALSHNKTYQMYTEHGTVNNATANQYPDAAVIGEINARVDKEGAVSMALNPLSGLSESGLSADGSTVLPLTASEITNLKAKGCDFLATPSSQTHFITGLAAGGNEVRVMIGKAFHAAKVSEETYGYLVANEVVVYGDDDLQALKGIADYWAKEMAKRKLLDESTFVWDWPEAADFTAAQKATHTLTLSNVFSATVLSAVNDITMTMSYSV